MLVHMALKPYMYKMDRPMSQYDQSICGKSGAIRMNGPKPDYLVWMGWPKQDERMTRRDTYVNCEACLAVLIKRSEKILDNLVTQLASIKNKRSAE